MSDIVKKGFVGRMAEYYGRKPGQTMPEFAGELKALTHDDKKWFVKEFNKMGLPTDEPVQLAAA